MRRAQLSFSPTARQGAQELCDAYRSAGLARNVQYGRDVRIRHIQRLLKAGQLDASLCWNCQGLRQRR
jgi:hypothetical protein